ncbi:hypothetical protein DL96DRAFT_1507941 [Flagelloscypha sp. PMI_526]|nr:hypothetical protein DL96DRAFT_1507941 [Flagelloscypha sp. PMI_526]
MRRAFSVDNIFSRFFTPDQITPLRRIQAKTNFVVSGSAAVQFFERTILPNSHMDLYVEEKHMKAVALFITHSGYVFKSSPHQPGTLLAALNDRSESITVSGEGPTKYGFIDTVPMTVFTFEKELTSGAVRKVQVIVTDRNDEVMAMILSFHSTLFMNIITYDSAIALFPVSSFHRHHTLVTVSNSTVDACLEKYRTRGWQAIRVGETLREDMHQECENGISRSTIDRWCWTIPLSPVEDCVSPGILEASWEVSQRYDLDSVLHAQMWII